MISLILFRSVHTPINPVQIQALGAVGPFDQLLILIETAVAVPIVEELMFRGLLFPALSSRWGYAAGVVLTSAVFGLLHPNLPAGFLPLWTLGAAFAVVFQQRKSLLPCIVMHSIHNGFVTIMMFMVFAR
jgi:membrane protease YdiL (CAAX protease family)